MGEMVYFPAALLFNESSQFFLSVVNNIALMPTLSHRA